MCFTNYLDYNYTIDINIYRENKCQLRAKTLCNFCLIIPYLFFISDGMKILEVKQISGHCLIIQINQQWMHFTAGLDIVV